MPVPMLPTVAVDTSRMAELNAMLKPVRKRGRRQSQNPQKIILPVGNMGALRNSEKRLLDLLCAGYNQVEAAGILGIGRQCAKMYTHRARVMTGCRTTISMAVQYAKWKEEQRCHN